MQTLKFHQHPKLQLALNELFLEYPLEGKTQSLKIGVLNKDQAYEFNFGHNSYTYYDLASLTKVIFTVSAIYNYELHVDQVLNRKVIDILPWFMASKTIKVKDLLAHQSGAPALWPIYKTLSTDTLKSMAPLNLILREIPFTEKNVVYSDVGFMVLGAILEQLYAKPLLQIFEHLRTEFNLGHIHFNPLKFKSKYPRSSYAPTENCLLRQKTIQGEVHDENCWRMGGVGPHAGLFGELKDVLIWLHDFKTKLAQPNNVNRSFLTQQKGDWRVGTMLPSRPTSSCGKYFSKSSWGHLGFTGTSFWLDPKKDLGVVILSHRTYPSRDNKSFNILRPLIHDKVYLQF